MYLKERGHQFLRFLHITAVSCWMGSLLCVLCLVWFAPHASTGEELFGMLRASVFISHYILVPVGAFGTCFTGLAYSLCTHRGFFRYTWVTLKWIITLVLVFMGIFWMGRLAGQELDDVYLYGLTAYNDPVIAANHVKRLAACFGCSVLLLICVLLSVYRPWESRPAAR